MPPYVSDGFSPPAPVAEVTLAHPETGVVISDVPMLVDTGADVTLVPHASIALIGAAPAVGESYELVAFDGSIVRPSAASIHLQFLRRTFRGKFLLSDQSIGVLGRDILNHLKLEFDGPNLTWNEPTRIG